MSAYKPRSQQWYELSLSIKHRFTSCKYH